MNGRKFATLAVVLATASLISLPTASASSSAKAGLFYQSTQSCGHVSGEHLGHATLSRTGRKVHARFSVHLGGADEYELALYSARDCGSAYAGFSGLYFADADGSVNKSFTFHDVPRHVKRFFVGVQDFSSSSTTGWTESASFSLLP